MLIISIIKAFRINLLIPIALSISSSAEAQERYAYFDTPEHGKICLSGNMSASMPQLCNMFLKKSDIDTKARKIFDAADEIHFLHEQTQGPRKYLALLFRIPSKPDNRSGYCGAGYEDIVMAIEFGKSRIKYFDQFKIQSCVDSISVDSSTPDNILNTLTAHNNGDIIFRWLLKPDDKQHVLHMWRGKFFLD